MRGAKIGGAIMKPAQTNRHGVGFSTADYPVRERTEDFLGRSSRA